MDLYQQTDFGTVAKVIWLDIMGLEFAENALKHQNVQKLLNSNEKFDMVILEQFLNEAYKGFCYKYKAICVVLSTVGTSRWTNSQMGNPASPSYVPDIYLNMSPNMSFSQRLHNSFIYLFGELFMHLYTFPKQNELLQKYFPGAPHLYELHYNTSLMLVNSHTSINPAVPYVPNMIDIGGFHMNAPKKLPKDLQDYLDNAKEGVIFFSMGSNLRSKDLPVEKRDAILKVLSKLKQNVLWKWEDETLPNQPSNVKLAKWLPQQDILAHPNIRLFITHGGLLSTIETIYHGVPVVGIPVFGDQEMNIANAEIGGYGKGVPYKKLTEERLSGAINEVLNNPKYAENAKLRSKIMHDRPIKPLDTAIFWLEYVLRHNGAPHLRTASLNLAWYQYLLLDVVAAVTVGVTIFSFIFYKVLMAICCRRSTKKVANKKKRN